MRHPFFALVEMADLFLSSVAGVKRFAILRVQIFRFARAATCPNSIARPN
jgi:hypothetical protein